jgi:hypothetical protein
MKTCGDDPAFPNEYEHPDTSPNGLTKREYFAAHALAGIGGRSGNAAERCKYALDMADAMIAALSDLPKLPQE